MIERDAFAVRFHLHPAVKANLAAIACLSTQQVQLVGSCYLGVTPPGVNDLEFYSACMAMAAAGLGGSDAQSPLCGIIEPGMTVILGLILGWVMLSVLGPVYDTISKMKF